MTIRLFEGFGVELEYMIVDRQTLAVRPLCDKVMHAVAGAYESEVEMGPLSWSNELVNHVIEFKTNGPAASLAGLAEAFQDHVGRVNELLTPMNAMLMPTAMHPFMDPHTETMLWPHEFNPVYAAFDRIFSCKGHGWSNLQCTHINLPFADDEEFGRLHAAIRLVLPILPALAACSPVVDGRMTEFADTRLEVYRKNAVKVPSASGRVIPEPAYTKAAYQAEILQPLYRDIAPYDPEGTLQFEWLNARGAIARFDRNTIEIRVLDIQECPAADLAIVSLVVDVVRALTQQRWTSFAEQSAWEIPPLERVLLGTIRDADEFVIDDAAYLATFGVSGKSSLLAGELWQHLFQVLPPDGAAASPNMTPLAVMLREGCLARRIRRALGPSPSRERIESVYRRLSECLALGSMFRVEA